MYAEGGSAASPHAIVKWCNGRGRSTPCAPANLAVVYQKAVGRDGRGGSAGCGEAGQSGTMALALASVHSEERADSNDCKKFI